MCLVNRQTTDLPESIEAFKVFAKYAGVLRSAFFRPFQKRLDYSLGVKLTVDSPGEVFYAFRTLHDAQDFIKEAITSVGDINAYGWDVVPRCPLVVHPVTLTNLVAIGEFSYLQYDGFWPAVEA